MSSHTLLWLHLLRVLRHDRHVLHVLHSMPMHPMWLLLLLLHARRRRRLPRHHHMRPHLLLLHARRRRRLPRHHHMRPHLLRPVHGQHGLPVHVALHLALWPDPAMACAVHVGGASMLLPMALLLPILLLGLVLWRRHAVPDLLLPHCDADCEGLLELWQSDEGDEERVAVVARHLRSSIAQGRQATGTGGVGRLR